MDGPISVRLQTDARDEILGDKCRGLTYRKVSDGGYAGGTLKLIGRWEDWRLGPNDHVFAYNGQNASVLWEGYCDNPGAQFDTDGESFEIGVQGAMTKAASKADPCLFLDTSHENWRSDDRNDERLSDASTAESSAWPDSEVDALMVSFASGNPIAKGSEARMVHDLCDEAPMGIGGFGFKTKGGLNANGYQWRVTLSNNGLVESGTMKTSTEFPAGVIGLTFPEAGDILKIRLRRTKGATNIMTDRVWVGFATPVVVGNRLKLDGTRQLDSLTDLTVVKAQQVVRDVVRRMMPKVNPRLSLVENDGTYEIDQLCYPDPVRATGILEDLNLFEPDMLWLIGPSDAGGYHTFTYRAWDTTPRYEISVADGYEAPGGEIELCNRLVVGWVGPKGQKRSTEVTQYVAELGGSPATAGAEIRDADKIELDESVSSRANALRIGEQVLRLKNHPPKAATATIVRPVYDSVAGRMVAPWEIEPGYLVRVRETGDDLRITEVEVNTEDMAAALTLGEPAPTQEQLIARLAKVTRRKR